MYLRERERESEQEEEEEEEYLSFAPDAHTHTHTQEKLTHKCLVFFEYYTDPVLVETLQALLKGATVVSRATQHQIGSTAQSGVGFVQRTTDRGVGLVQRALPSRDALVQTSTELVEQLIQSSGTVQNVLVDFQERAPKPVWQWTQQQYRALKESGLLEEAASRAVKALQGELEAASAFLPYLDAIERVRKQQDKEKQKKNKKQQQQQQRRKR